MRGLRLAPRRLQSNRAKHPICYFSTASALPSLSPHGTPSVAALLAWKPEQPVDHVVINGFVRTIRPMKTAHFVAVSDGSSVTPLQAILPIDRASGCAAWLQIACLTCPRY